MPKYPTLPRNTSNPVGGARLQQQTVSRLKRGLRDVRRWVLERFNEIPRREITINAQVPGYVVNETRYEYLISVEELRLIVDEIRRRLGIEVPTGLHGRSNGASVRGRHRNRRGTACRADG